ncbi:MAG: hypothetical protein AB4372_13805, partial [Xenococcus sp. (in: cyanobacteria)]
LLMLVKLGLLISLVNPKMALSQSKYSLRSVSSDVQLTVDAEFCLHSSNECVAELTERAIANSFKLETLTTRIALIDERLELAEDRIDYVSKKSWTNYISTNPVNIIQNIFGGGNVQRDRIAIASLEIRTADLLAAKAELERQQSEEKVEIGDRVLRLLLNYEAAERRHELLKNQLSNLEIQEKVARVSYRAGRGSTSQMLSMSDKRDRLTEKLINEEIRQTEAVRELGQLIR